MSQENNTTPSARNREAYAALTEMGGNVPPQAVELEEAVLGALMLEKDSIITVQEFVTPEAFYTEEHRLIYRAIEELSSELKPIDLYTVTERLKVKKELKKVGGASYLAQLTQKVGSAANVEFHAKIVAQKYVQRELIRSATEIQRRSYDESTDVTDLIGFAEQEIFKVAEGHVKRSVQSAADVLARTLAQIEENAKNKSAFNGVPSGFMALDRVTMGWQPSDLIIIAARPSMGKTAFTLTMARNMSVDHEQAVAFFSLEMPAHQLMMRLVVAETGIPGNDLKLGRLSPEQWRHLESATKPLGSAKLFIDDTPALSVFEFRSKARRLKIHNDIKIIMIDYLQLMTGGPQAAKGGNREQEVSFISRTLKAIAKELNVPIIALSQLNRSTELRRLEAAAAVGPARVGRHRAGRRHRGLHPPSRILRHQPGRERNAHGGYGRADHRQAPQRRRDRRQAALPERPGALRRHRRRRPAAGRRARTGTAVRRFRQRFERTGRLRPRPRIDGLHRIRHHAPPARRRSPLLRPCSSVSQQEPSQASTP